MRDVVVFVLFVALLPACFFRPWVGLMVFTWLAYNRTQDLTWGFARALPISQVVAMAMTAGWIVWEFRPLLRRDVRLWAMIALVGLVGASIAVNTVRWSVQGSRYEELIKIIYVALLSGALCVTRARLRGVMFVICLALGFYGVKNAIWFMLGQGTGVGPGGMLKDNNDFALAMVMNLPLLWYLADDVQHPRWGRMARLGLRAAFFMTMFTIMSTGSRGGFLAMGVVVMVMCLKTRWKLPAMLGMGLVALIGLMIAPSEYLQRLGTITEAKDESVVGRIVSWKVSWEMIKDKPFLGIGFKNMVYEYQRYVQHVKLPGGVQIVQSRVAHNSYLQVWAETGTIALLVFLFMVGSTILLMRRTARRARPSPDAWIVPYTNAIEVCLYGYLSGAMFLNRAHFDLLYQLVAVAAAIPAIVLVERVVQAQRDRAARRGPGTARRVTIGGRTHTAGARG